MSTKVKPFDPADIIGRLRQQGLSQAQIAKAVGVKQCTISRAGQGRQIRMSTFFALCNLVNKLERQKDVSSEEESWI